VDEAVRVVTTVERRTAVVARSTTWDEFPRVWRGMLDEVYAFLRQGEVRQEGHNVMLYRDDVPNVEVGVEVTGPFSATGRVVPSVLPACEAAMTVHRGPYDGLDRAHRTVRDWCERHGRALTGVRWEIYGDWHEDPSRLETEVYYLLA
jgi:effector-binding domain-containing protein